MRETEKALEKVAEIEAAAGRQDATIRTVRRIEEGHYVRQGDVYLYRVAGDHPRGAAMGSRQVAVGSTVGARHVADGAVEVFAGASPAPKFKADRRYDPAVLTGPVVEASETWTLTHPEHAHVRMPAGTYQVHYQADETTRGAVVD